MTAGDSEMDAPGKQPTAPVSVKGDQNPGSTAAADVIAKAVAGVQKLFPDLKTIDKAKLTQSLTAAGHKDADIKKIFASLGIK